MFKYAYSAEPLDHFDLMTPAEDYIRALVETASKCNYYEQAEYEALRAFNRYHFIVLWMQAMKKEFASKVFVFPYVFEYMTYPVYVVKESNNGTTYYFSDTELVFPGVSMKRMTEGWGLGE